MYVIKKDKQCVTVKDIVILWGRGIIRPYFGENFPKALLF